MRQKKNKLNSDIITAGLMVSIFCESLRPTADSCSIHVIKMAPSINKLRALQAPPNDETKTTADAIIKDYFTEEGLRIPKAVAHCPPGRQICSLA